MTEELTAEERYTVELLSGRLAGAGCLGKLLRLYDAALAQAEAAEAACQQTQGCHVSWVVRGDRAETALAEATALLELTEKAHIQAHATAQRYFDILAEARAALSEAMTSAGNNPHWKGWERLTAALSRTPAPAAKVEPVLCHPTDPCAHGITGPCSRCQP